MFRCFAKTEYAEDWEERKSAQRAFARFAQSVKSSFPSSSSAEVDIFDASSNLRIVREEYALYLPHIHPGTNLRFWYIRIPKFSMYTSSSLSFSFSHSLPFSVSVCVNTHAHSRLPSVYTEKWCSELSLSSMQNRFCRPRVHCIIQFWSLAIKKRNKGRAIALAQTTAGT